MRVLPYPEQSGTWYITNGSAPPLLCHPALFVGVLLVEYPTMDSRQPKEDLLPVCDGQADSEVAAELQQQENAIMKELSNAKRATEQFSQRASEAAEERDALSEELSEAVSSQSMDEARIHAALQKSKMEVHHCEHEAMLQKKASTKAEQAGRDLARSLSEFQAEENANMVSQIQHEAEAARLAKERADASNLVPLSPSAFVAQLGVSKLKSNCPISKRTCDDHDASLWWALVVGNLSIPVQEWIEDQEFTECDDLREAATVQVHPIRVEAAVVFARGSTFKEGTGHFLSLVQMHKLISLKNFGQERLPEATVSSPETPIQGGT